jgi:hypothetical protein
MAWRSCEDKNVPSSSTPRKFSASANENSFDPPPTSGSSGFTKCNFSAHWSRLREHTHTRVRNFTLFTASWTHGKGLSPVPLVSGRTVQSVRSTRHGHVFHSDQQTRQLTFDLVQ